MKPLQIVILVIVVAFIALIVGRVTSNNNSSVAVVPSPTPVVTISVPVPPPPPSVIGYWKSDSSIWTGDLKIRPGGTGLYADWPMTWRQNGNSMDYPIVVNSPRDGILHFVFKLGDNPKVALLDIGGSTSGYTKFSDSPS